MTRHPGNRPLRRGAVAPAPAAARPAAEVQPWAENAAGAEGPSPRESAAARQALWVGLLLATAVSLAYAPIVRNDFVSYDDPPLIVENPIVNGGLSPGTLARAWTTFYRSNWMPLTWHSHQVVWALAGKTPLAHHLVNLALHVLNVLLVFWLARRITGLLRWTALWPAALAGALFGLHPLHVESVAWAAERKDVLSTAFWLLTCHAYLTYARRPGAARYALVAVLFALGLTAKPMLVTLPLALLLVDWWPLGRLRFGRAARSAGEPAARPWLEKIPLLVLSAGSSVVTYLAQKSGGAVASTNAYSIGSRVANAITSYATYLYKYVAPSGLAVFVPRPPEGPPGVAVLLSAVALGAITWLAWSRREREPWLLMGWLWYLGTLVPVIGLLQVGEQALAWRYTYVPMIGIDLALVLSLASLSGVRSSEKRIARARGGPLRPIPVAAGSGAILLALAAATSAQVMVWKDSETLYRFALRVTDRNHVALNNLGAIYLVEGRKQEALPLFEQAVAIQPEYFDGNRNLGKVLTDLHRYDLAIAALQTAVRLRPDEIDAHLDYAQALGDAGRLDQALSEYEWLGRHLPGDPRVPMHAGGALFTAEHYEEAIARFRQALALDPKNALALVNLGKCLQHLGRQDESVASFERALAIDPRQAGALTALGELQYARGEADAALQRFRLATEADPKLFRAAFMYAFVLHQQGKLDEAAQAYEKALQVDTESAAAHNNLGAIELVRGRYDLARDQFREALRIDPGYAEAKSNLARSEQHLPASPDPRRISP